jgi:hypothetical protein
MHFADKAFIAETTAKMLLEVKAVLFFQDKPFVFTSGWASPVYIDCRNSFSIHASAVNWLTSPPRRSRATSVSSSST